MDPNGEPQHIHHVDEQIMKPIPGYESQELLELNGNMSSKRPTATGGSFGAFPWMGVLSILLVLGCGVAGIMILVFSNGKATSQWTIQPTVYLAAFNAAAGALLIFALSEGVAIYRWRAALSGSQVSKTHLDQNWRFGTSLWAAVTAGKHTNFVLLATIFVATMAVNGILIQRATTTTLKTITGPTSISAMVAQEFPYGYTSFSGGRKSAVDILTPRFVQVAKKYSQNTPITNGFGGCHGTCYGNISAAGLYPTCTVQEETEYITASQTTVDKAQTAFSTNFTMGFGGSNSTAPNISLTISILLRLREARVTSRGKSYAALFARQH